MSKSLGNVISPDETFQAAIQQAANLVQSQPQTIVTFGIRPTYPAESFGYIERGEALDEDQEPSQAPVFRVRMFREKPTAEVAEQYLAAGDFYWNSGIFVWRAQTILGLLEEYEPAMYERIARIRDAIGNPDFDNVFSVQFEQIQGKSIDYAVIMSGELTMRLDEGEVVLREGDVLVQRGTMHDWVNNGTEPCFVAFILCAAKELEVGGRVLGASG